MGAKERLGSVKERLATAVRWIVGFLVILWIIELINMTQGHDLCAYGIRPRTVPGLLGIVFSPLLHASAGHLLLNSIPLAVLGFLVVIRGVGSFLGVSLFIVLVGGAAVWAVGSAGQHVGASGLVFGYFGFLIARGWYVRDIGSILVAVAVLALYGGLIWGVLPLRPYVSWESHLFGLIAGVLAGRTQARSS